MIDKDSRLPAEARVLAFIPPAIAAEHPAPEIVAAADRTSRHWTSAETAAWRPGSEIHRREVCRMFRETFNPYRPSAIDWPELTPQELHGVTSLPIWDIAVQTEGKARLRFAAYAATVADPEMQAAIMLNAWEENRHKEVLSKLVAAYGIPLAVEPAYQPPRDVEWSYLVTGYSECIDSFFAFGLFELARQSGFFPMALVETFEPVVQEECRHILLFANWLAWHRANLPWARRLRFELRVAAVWGFIAWERIGLARSIDAEGNGNGRDSNFTVTGAQAVSPVEIRFRDLIGLCLRENDRRFAGYDRRLARPTTIPWLAQLVLRVTAPWTREGRRPPLQSESRS